MVEAVAGRMVPKVEEEAKWQPSLDPRCAIMQLVVEAQRLGLTELTGGKNGIRNATKESRSGGIHQLDFSCPLPRPQRRAVTGGMSPNGCLHVTTNSPTYVSNYRHYYGIASDSAVWFGTWHCYSLGSLLIVVLATVPSP